MNNRIVTARIVHDLSLSSWFGGELMGAIGLNGAAAQVSDPRQRSRAANAGWRRFSPILLGSVAAHLASGSVLVKEDRDRLKTQEGFARGSAIKTALTGAALAATAYQQVLGQRMNKGGDQPIHGATQPSIGTAPEQASAQRQLNVLQFLIPALTGSAWVVHSANGELTRSTEQARGTVARFTSVVSGDRRPLVLAAAAGTALLALRRRRSGGTVGDTAGYDTGIRETSATQPVGPGPVSVTPLPPVRDIGTTNAGTTEPITTEPITTEPSTTGAGTEPAPARIDLDSASLTDVDRSL